jgi:hypothetical protein
MIWFVNNVPLTVKNALTMMYAKLVNPTYSLFSKKDVLKNVL